MIRFNLVNPNTGKREKVEAPKWSDWPAFRKQLMKLSPKFHAIMSA